MQIKWSVDAKDDLRAIVKYIQQRDGIAARKLADRIKNDIRQLSEFPFSGPEGRISETREMVFTPYPYIAVYRVWDHAVEIVRIFHGSRDWP